MIRRMIPRFARRLSGPEANDRGPQTDAPALPETDGPTDPAIQERGLKPRSDLNRIAASEILFDRLTETDVAHVEERIEPWHRWAWDHAHPGERKRMTLSFGLLYGIEGVIVRSGLSPATPPPDVHSMVHGLETEIGGS